MIRRQEPVFSARRRKRSGVQHGSPIPLMWLGSCSKPPFILTIWQPALRNAVEPVKSYCRPLMTLGNAASTHVRLIEWCRPFGEPRFRRASRLRREPHGFAGCREYRHQVETRHRVTSCRQRWHKCRSRCEAPDGAIADGFASRNGAAVRPRDSRCLLARAARLFSLRESRSRYGGVTGERG